MLRWIASMVMLAVGQSVFAATVISEDFSSGSPDFTAVSGGTWSVSSGRLVLSSAADSGANGILGNIAVHNTQVSGDYTVSGLIRITGTSSSWNDGALVFGYQDSNDYYYLSLNESNDSYTKGIFKVVSGTPTELVDIGSSIAADTDYTVEVERTGSSIVVRLNGSQIASISDSTFSGGQFGFGSKNDGGQFDNLVVVDNSGGSLSYEAEAYTSTSGCSISTQHSGYTGSGYVDFGGNGTWVEWNSINVGNAGSATLTVAFANGGSTSRDCILSVNGSSVGSVSLPQTGSWTSWSTTDVQVTLNSGNNTIRLTANSSFGGPNIDSLLFTLSGSSQVVAPQFSPGGGTYSSAQNVTISSTTSGATIRYTTDGSNPTSSTGTVYSNPILISSTSTLKAIAYKSGMTDSTVASASYTVNIGTVNQPQFSPSGGTYSSSQSVTISSTTSGATIRYTMDGSNPSSSSGTIYSGAISVSSTSTLKAIAYKSGMIDSAITSATYTINSGGGFPNDSNTGWQHTGVTLTPMSGTVTITTDGYVLDSVDISGVLRINANNVTVKRSRIRGSGGSSAVILVQSGKSGAQIIDTEVDGLGSSNNAIVSRTNATILRCKITNSSDGIRPDDNTTIEDCYIKLPQPPSGAHCDGIQTYGATYVNIIHNNIDLAGQTSVNGAIFIDNGSHHITVEGNLLNGGAYAFKGGGNYIVVTDNTFGQKYSSVCGIYGPVNGYSTSSTGNEWSNNEYEGGGSVTP